MATPFFDCVGFLVDGQLSEIFFFLKKILKRGGVSCYCRQKKCNVRCLRKQRTEPQKTCELLASAVCESARIQSPWHSKKNHGTMVTFQGKKEMQCSLGRRASKFITRTPDSCSRRLHGRQPCTFWLVLGICPFSRVPVCTRTHLFKRPFSVCIFSLKPSVSSLSLTNNQHRDSSW